MRSQPHFEASGTSRAGRPRRSAEGRRTLNGVAIAAMWALDCMATPVHGRKPAAMRTPPPAPPVHRAPDNELYDHGCDLVQAASAIAHAATSAEAARALPAALGCIEAALRELRLATVAMEQTTITTTAACETADTHRRRRAIDARMHRGYASLQRALDDAHGAAAASRALVARALETASGGKQLRRGRSA
jgi:hypothetical protein